MDIIQTFYDNMATHYDKLFHNWDADVKEQAEILEKLFFESGFGKESKILDCACGIGTQAIGLAKMGYIITASDISDSELEEAKKRAQERNVCIQFEKTDFRSLAKTFSQQFDIVIAMDNALPHMLTKIELEKALSSISDRIRSGGIFVASIRDYDTLLQNKPPYSPPYIHKTEKGQRVSFQTWKWNGDIYRLTQYIIEDEDNIYTSKFECEYRAVLREEITSILMAEGFCSVYWKFPNETGFYQPIVIAKKK